MSGCSPCAVIDLAGRSSLLALERTAWWCCVRPISPRNAERDKKTDKDFRILWRFGSHLIGIAMGLLAMIFMNRKPASLL